MRRKHIIGLGLLLAAATSVPAFAQPVAQGYSACTKAVSTSESSQAHDKYIAGKQDYDEGSYDSALRRFRDAYNLDCTKHELLIIISAAYERKGERKEAVSALETYVARAPSAPDAGTYQAKIENLKKQLSASTTPTSTAPSTASNTASPPGAEMRDHSPWPWVLVGVGGAAVIVGLVVLLTTPSLPAGCNKDTEACGPLPDDTPQKLRARQEEAGRVNSQPTVGALVTVGGAILVAGGLVWHFLEPTGPKELGKTKLRPSLSPGYAGLSVGGTF